MEVHTSKLTRPPSSLLRSPTLRSSFHTLAALDSLSSDPEEIKPHSPPPSSSPSPSSSLLLPFLSLLLLLLLLLSFLYLRDLSPSLLNLSLASAAVAAASLILKRSPLSFPLRRRRRTDPVRWFIGDEEDAASNPQLEEAKAVREGVEFYSNGDFYEGEFHRGKCGGSGVYNFFGQGRYEGDWIDGKYDGCGIERWARGSRYRGQYRSGLRHGFGVYRFYNGDCYSGEWVGGQSYGRGAQSCSDGSCYSGEFKFGVKHGLGFYHFRNGDKFGGEYFGDKIHGFGVYHFANGHCYEGSWHEGRRQGFGTYTFRRGEARSGEWDCGTLKNSLPIADSNVQRAMQSARKASEKSVLLPRVEEQVNKAVAAANRAATTARVAAIKAVENRMNGKFCITEV